MALSRHTAASAAWSTVRLPRGEEEVEEEVEVAARGTSRASAEAARKAQAACAAVASRASC